jgi:hypothetical protein
MGQADLFASRCSVKGCREQKIFIWLAHCGNRIGFTGKSCPREGKGEKEKVFLNKIWIFFFGKNLEKKKIQILFKKCEKTRIFLQNLGIPSNSL